MRPVRAEDFDFDLPRELVAQEPPVRREDARLLVLGRRDGTLADRGIVDLPGLLRPGDLLVVNDTRVLAARLLVRRRSGGRGEVLLTGPTGAGEWDALVRSGGSLRAGEVLLLERSEGSVRLVERLGGGRWRVAPVGEGFDELMERGGKMPLPPYIRREDDDPRDAADRERYQTVYARRPGAIAAPTAGLHLTPALLDRIRERGAAVAQVTLHVGIGTFRPLTEGDLSRHEMHAERYEIPVDAAAAIRAARGAGGRVVAVGTTSVRALEGAAEVSTDGLPAPGPGATELFITPGFEFRVVDALLTNFHLPRSTLLCLVSAFAGRESIRCAYAHAVAARYRFFSYGDAMFIA